MGERKGQNHYYPPDFDPEKHGNLNRYHGTHALRERARKIKQGIIIIRFEMPFNVWCGTCGEHIGMGVRYDAEKSKIGNYYSTPIFQFRFQCYECGGFITIKTDPANQEYVVTEGARRKEQRWRPEDNEQIVATDRETAKKLALDAMFATEFKKTDSEKDKAPITEIEEIKDRMRDDYSANQYLRQQFRVKRDMRDAQAVSGKALAEKSSLDIDILGETATMRAKAKELANQKTVSASEIRGVKRDEISVRPLFERTTRLELAEKEALARAEKEQKARAIEAPPPKKSKPHEEEFIDFSMPEEESAAAIKQQEKLMSLPLDQLVRRNLIHQQRQKQQQEEQMKKVIQRSLEISAGQIENADSPEAKAAALKKKLRDEEKKKRRERLLEEQRERRMKKLALKVDAEKQAEKAPKTITSNKISQLLTNKSADFMERKELLAVGQTGEEDKQKTSEPKPPQIPDHIRQKYAVRYQSAGILPQSEQPDKNDNPSPDTAEKHSTQAKWGDLMRQSALYHSQQEFFGGDGDGGKHKLESEKELVAAAKLSAEHSVNNDVVQVDSCEPKLTHGLAAETSEAPCDDQQSAPGSNSDAHCASNAAQPELVVCDSEDNEMPPQSVGNDPKLNTSHSSKKRVPSTEAESDPADTASSSEVLICDRQLHKGTSKASDNDSESDDCIVLDDDDDDPKVSSIVTPKPGQFNFVSGVAPKLKSIFVAAKSKELKSVGVEDDDEEEEEELASPVGTSREATIDLRSGLVAADYGGSSSEEDS